MNFEIFAYWNTVELAGVFNAIAALTGGSDFKGLLKTLSLVAVLAVVLAALGGKGKVEDFWRWVILLGIFNGMLLVPKATVQIVDRTGAAPTMVVANVPLGLASLAHGTSKIGDWLTTSYETVFSLPDEVQLRKNGTLFGHRVARERLLMTTTNPLITHNLVEFYRECVLPSIATGNFSAKDIFESSDIWTTLAAVNPGLMVQLVNPSTGVPYDPESCGDAYTKQTPHLTAEAENVAKEKGAAYYPNVSSALATTTFKNSLASTTSYLLNVSKTAPDLIKQAMVGNAIIDAGYKVAAQMGDPSTAQVKLAEAQSLRAFNVSYSTQANLATETMPKLRNVIEIVTYAMFPIVALLIIISGPHGLTLLKSYVSALLWVQLWAPLYAVMNYIINVKAASGMSMGTAGNGLALKYYNYVGSSVASDEAITGVLVIAIPALAWGIVKGTMDAASAIKSAVGGGGGTYASNASQGNITMGNSSLNTSKADMGTHGQYNEAPTLARGSGVATSRGVDGIKTSSFMDGSHAVDGSDIAHKGNLQVVAGSKIGQSAQKQSEVAEQAAGGHQVAAAQKTAAALQRAADFVQGRKASEGTRSSDSISHASGVTEAVATALKAIETFGDKNSLTNKQAAQVLASVSASGGLNLGVANVNAAAQLSGQSGSEAAQLLERARSFAKESGYSKAVDLVRRSTHENAFGTADESSRNASDTIRAGFDQAKEHTDQSNASYQRSVALKDVASKMRENSGSWSASHVRQFVDWMAGQRNDFENTNFTPQSVMHTAEHNPELLNPFVERFMQEQVAPKLGTGVGSVMTSSDVGAFYKEEVGKVPTSASVQEQGKGWLSNVREQASANGVPPSERVESQLPGQVNEALGDGRQSVTDGKAGAEAAGKPVEAKATNQTDPTNTNLLGNAVSNGAAKVLPAGTMYLADKVGAIPDSASVAKPTATEYKGDTTSALIETGAFVAGTAIGGVGGRAVGSVVGEAIGGVAGRAAAQATLPGVVTATQVSYGAIGEKFGTGVGAVAGEMLGAKGAAATNTLRDAEKETVPTERVESQLPGHVNEALGDGRQSVTDGKASAEAAGKPVEAKPLNR